MDELLLLVRRDFPNYTITTGDDFSWAPATKTIRVDAKQNSPAQLLHEIAHAELDHQTFSRDIQLIEMEREAWEYCTKVLAPRYDVSLAMDDDVVQESLDSYRLWLTSRSSCPHCGAIGLQKAKDTYSCMHCHVQWQVNEARACRLIRTIKNTPGIPRCVTDHQNKI